jgi:hypothetical protein
MCTARAFRSFASAKCQANVVFVPTPVLLGALGSLASNRMGEIIVIGGKGDILAAERQRAPPVITPI